MERSNDPGTSLRAALTVAAVLVASIATGCSGDVHEGLTAATPHDDEEPSWSEVATPPTAGAAPAIGFGAFTYGGVWQGMEPVLALEDALGRPLDVVHWFTHWGNPYFPEMVEAVAEDGRAPLISWQPDAQPVADIARGAHDDYVRSWARGVATAPGLVYIRPFPEMNGDWVPWNGDPDALRSAWRRIAAIFRDEGADNVRWVFGPNVTDEPRTADNAMERYYPGHDVVDVLALSGYNWGATRPAIGWRDFETIFRTGYDRLTTLGPQDVWLAEVASAEDGGDKSAWVHDMFARETMDRFARLTMVVWFDQDKEADWRIRSRPEVVQAFRAHLALAGAPEAAGAPQAATDAAVP